MAWRDPIPGASPGNTRRKCGHSGAWQLVRAFHGVELWQCLTCRKVSQVETRTGKTCLNCGSPLTGRKYNWCSEKCWQEFVASKDRRVWAEAVAERDGHTCQRCGWQETPEVEAEYLRILRELWDQEIKRPIRERAPVRAREWEARRLSGYRQLEAHHKIPLEWGGPEFDLDNGELLCDQCHDEVHRELKMVSTSGGGPR